VATTTVARGSTREVSDRPSHAFIGAWALVRFAFRRDRLRLAIWVGAICGFLLLVVSSFPELYPDAAARQARATLMDNPTGILFTGPGYGVEDYTFGAMIANEMMGSVAIFLALMSIFTVTRHTRSEEEEGRTELLRASPVGRHADTAAAVVVAVAANLAIAIGLTLGLPAMGADLPMASSALFGFSVASVGVVFAGVAALGAQATQHSRGANAIGGAAIALVFTLRAAGDAATAGEPGAGTLSWLSPIGWAQATRVFVDDRWWPLGLALLSFFVLFAVALLLSDQRDVGAGLLPPRTGRRRGSAALGTPFGLAFRLQRSTVSWWAFGLFAFGMMYGGFFDEVEQFVEANQFIADMLEEFGATDFANGFAAQLASLLAMLVAVFGVQSALRPRSEETSGRAEPLLATALGRQRWALGHVSISLGGSLVILLLAGLGLGLTSAAVTGESSWITTMPRATLVYAPAVWLLVALATALFGLLPRYTAVAWAILGYAIAVGFMGPMLGLPRWLVQLTPFGHIPAWPAGDFVLLPLVLATAIAGALLAAGLYGIRHRDLHSNA
jgi:ABC-2 type transport system permease protein